MSEPRKCWCVINHPQMPEERAEVENAMTYARLIGDTQAIILCALMLGGPCPAWQPADQGQADQGQGTEHQTEREA